MEAFIWKHTDHITDQSTLPPPRIPPRPDPKHLKIYHKITTLVKVGEISERKIKIKASEVTTLANLRQMVEEKLTSEEKSVLESSQALSFSMVDFNQKSQEIGRVFTDSAQVASDCRLLTLGEAKFRDGYKLKFRTVMPADCIYDLTKGRYTMDMDGWVKPSSGREREEDSSGDSGRESHRDRGRESSLEREDSSGDSGRESRLGREDRSGDSGRESRDRGCRDMP